MIISKKNNKFRVKNNEMRNTESNKRERTI